MAGTNPIELYLDSTSLRRAAKRIGKKINYEGLMQGLKLTWKIEKANIYMIRNMANETDKLDGFISQATKANYTPIVQELARSDGFFEFTTKLALDTMDCKTEYIGIGTSDISILPAFELLVSRGHKIVFLGVEPMELLAPYISHSYSVGI
jgi:hypothetical protein